MKRLMIILGLALLSFKAQAQVNLDEPIPVGANDIVYRSTADANSAYLIPTRLIVLNTPRISEIDGEYRTFFDVGMDPGQFAPIQEKIAGLLDASGAPLSLRMMKGYDAKIDPKGSMDTPKEFKARLEPLGDAGSLGAPLPYMFAIKKIGPKLGQKSQAILADLFSSLTARHLGSIAYEFNAIKGGVPYSSRTMIGIFSVNLGELVYSAKLRHQPTPFSLTADGAVSPEVYQPEILLDSEKPCWESVQIGQICLKK